MGKCDKQKGRYIINNRILKIRAKLSSVSNRITDSTDPAMIASISAKTKGIFMNICTATKLSTSFLKINIIFIKNVSTLTYLPS